MPATPDEPRHKVCILGYTKSREEAPWDDEEWEIWGCNNLWKFVEVEKATGWFDLHDLPTIKSDPEHEAWLRTAPLPVFVWDPQPEWQNAVAYPRQEILDAFSEFSGGRYFTNSISWMIAMALSHLILAGEDGKPPEDAELGIYGVDMAQGCLGPDTRVLTADLQWKEIGRVREGDELIAYDEEPSENGRRQWRKTLVTQAEPLMRPCYRLLLEDGTKIVASADHRWLTHAENTRRFRATDKLVGPHHRKDRPSKMVKVVEPWEPVRSWEAGYLAAAFDGEGHLTHKPGASHQLGFAQRLNGMSAQVEEALRNLGFDFHRNGRDCANYSVRGGRSEHMRLLGQVRPPRLLDKFDADNLGEFARLANVPVVEAEYIGEQLVIGLKTETGTYIAEGYASHNSEYAAQRPSCEYWIGLAEAMGIQVTIPTTSDLLKSAFLYGSDDGSSVLRAKLLSRQAELNEKYDACEAEKNQLMARVNELVGLQNQVVGARDTGDYLLNVWMQPEGTRGGEDPLAEGTTDELGSA